MNSQNKKIVLVIVAIVVIGAIFFLERGKAGPASKTIVSGELSNNGDVVVVSKAKKMMMYEPAKEIVNPSGFLNTPEGTKIQDFIGKKVVLVDFWTYSCINCQRTTPYLNAWYEKYKDEGLEIVSIHTPEFEFEKDIDNVAQAAEKFGVKYPIILDNDYSTWRAYKNRYWPRKYLVDIDGYIVYDHIGEGAYEETEKKIQELLHERKLALGEEGEISGGIVDPNNKEEVVRGMVKSPEVYFGSSRNSLLSNGAKGVSGTFDFLEPTDEVELNKLYLVGKWKISDEYAEALSSDAKILFKYQAGKVFMVATAVNGANVQVSKNDKVEKTLNVKEEELYRIIEDGAYGENILELNIKNLGFQIFTFTFG